MKVKERETKVRELIDHFQSRIEGLRRDGLRYEASTSGFVPWSYAPEDLELEEIVGAAQSATIAGGNWMSVPGTVVLEVVERDVDYSKLSKKQRYFLQALPGYASQDEDSDRYTTMALARLVETWWVEKDHRWDAESDQRL